MAGEYYVYILFRENGVPFYVGMARWARRWRDFRQISARRNMIANDIIRRGFAVMTAKIAEGLSKEEACEIERFVIARLGREPDGPLINQTSGGIGSFGMSSEARAKISASVKGKINSPETRAKMGAWQIGRKLSPETIRRRTESRRRNEIQANG